MSVALIAFSPPGHVCSEGKGLLKSVEGVASSAADSDGADGVENLADTADAKGCSRDSSTTGSVTLAGLSSLDRFAFP